MNNDLPPLTHAEAAEAEKLADQGVGNPYMGRAAMAGSWPDDNVASSSKQLPPNSDASPRKKRSSGHVRDFQDGGRADEHRGGFGVPETGADNYVPPEVLKNLVSQRDALVFSNLISDYVGELEDCDRGNERSPQVRAVARWRGHIDRHYPKLSDSEVQEMVNEFAHALLDIRVEY